MSVVSVSSKEARGSSADEDANVSGAPAGVVNESQASTMSSITATHISTTHHTKTTARTTTVSGLESTREQKRGSTEALLGISSEDDYSSDDEHDRDE